jgi:hypothetical protein
MCRTSGCGVVWSGGHEGPEGLATGKHDRDLGMSAADWSSLSPERKTNRR